MQQIIEIKVYQPMGYGRSIPHLVGLSFTCHIAMVRTWRDRYLKCDAGRCLAPVSPHTQSLLCIKPLAVFGYKGWYGSTVPGLMSP